MGRVGADGQTLRSIGGQVVAAQYIRIVPALGLGVAVTADHQD